MLRLLLTPRLSASSTEADTLELTPTYTIRLSGWHSGNANEMNSESDEHTSSTTSPHEQDPMVDISHELNGSDNDRKGRFVRLWKVPVPVRRGRIIADSFKSFALLVTAV